MEFLVIVNPWKEQHKELFANGTWTVKMLNQIQRLIYVPQKIIKDLKDGIDVANQELVKQKEKAGLVEPIIIIGKTNPKIDAIFQSITFCGNLKRDLEYYNSVDYIYKLLWRENYGSYLEPPECCELYYKSDDNFIVGLVEGLFNLNDFNTSIVFYSQFLKSRYGLQMLREKLINIGDLKNFKGDYETFFNDPNSIIGLRNCTLKFFN